MSETSHPNIPLWIQQRIVAFFNNARNVDMILDGTIQDDPSDGSGNTMGPVLAARILRERNNLPNRRFTDFEQIDNIRGVGEGTVQDLVYSFGQHADEAFKQNMYDSGTIFESNWPLEYFRFPIEGQADFEAIANDPNALRTFILAKVNEVCDERNVQDADRASMVNELQNAYIDPYTNSTSEASYAFSLWFYRFDADNWFSWERIVEQTTDYFEHNMFNYPWMMDFYLFKGFQNRGIILSGISAKDLPVVVNWSEQSISFWISELYD
jgi:hypothetical protein